MPAAEDAKKDSMEINRKLLQKSEELTRYLIELKRKLLS